MKILHITDLHIGWEQDTEKEAQEWERLYREILGATKNGKGIDMAAVTGDLVMHGTEDEYRRVEIYLHHLRKLLGLEAKQVVFCHGNHDSDTPEAGSSFFQYEAFLERFYKQGKKEESFFTDKEKKEPFLMGQEEKTAEAVKEKGIAYCRGIPVFSINSCKKTSLERFNDCWLEPGDVERILENAETEKRAVLLMHHQPEMFEDQKQIERLNRAVGLILGGHLHCGYTRQYEWKGMTVVNGLAVKPHLTWIPKGFQIVEWRDNGAVETWMYVYQEKEGVIAERA